jgi:UDP-GlcNAc:undecaprenyl-phosphate GlcNAc-1-phosphate transferase
MEIIFLLLLIFLFNLLIFIKFHKFSNFFVVFDKPDGKLKKHNKAISLIGGFIILVNLYLIIFFLKILNMDNVIFEDNFLYIVSVLSFLFYFIGFVDDFKNLSPNLKLFLIIISIILVTLFFPELKLEYIKISFLYKDYVFGDYAFIFIILSFALLANAINMFDGINLQLISYTLFIFLIFIINSYLPLFFILLSICFIFLGILNYKNKVFIGDGGCYLISSIIGCTFIYQYKNFSNYLYGDQIFIILLIPAIDMFRLFLVRLINKKNPFRGDLNHLHHIIDRFIKNKNLTVIITLNLCILPTLLMYLGIQTYFILAISLLIYFSLISFLGYKYK